jgi:ArsR family transcriptional regulator
MAIKNMVLYEMQAKICHALSHPVRLYILDLVSEGEKNCTEMLEVLEIPKANLSQHLNVLKDAGIVKMRKEGQFQYVTLAIPKIKDACSLVRGILVSRVEEQEAEMNALKKHLKKTVQG